MITENLLQSADNGSCHLAWHITSKCNLRCPHCLRNSPSQPTEDLPPEQLKEILPMFLDFAEGNNRSCSVEFSGGNPLLHIEFPYLLKETAKAKRNGQVKSIRILGNPETLDEGMVSRLKDYGVDSFFISLDGLEEANDQMRGRGNFKAALKGIRSLVNAGIKTSVKFTLMRQNAAELPRVLDLAHREGVDHVGIGHLITAGGGYSLRNERLTPDEYRQFLIDTLGYLDKLPQEAAAIKESVMRGHSLYALLMHELGRSDEYQALGKAKIRNSAKGKHVLFVVWSDGEVVSRREMPRVGYVPRNTFQEIYDNAPILKIMEDREEISRQAIINQNNHIICRDCPVAERCRPSLKGIFSHQLLFAPNRDCWRLANTQNPHLNQVLCASS